MTQYFARFTNSSGSVLTGDTTSAQWFGIGDPAFSISQTLTFRSGATDIDAGEASFSALSLTLGSSTLTGKIDQALQSGAAFKTIEIVGYDSIADKLVKTSSLVLKGAYAASDAIDTYFGTHALSFTYGDIVQSVGSYDADGNLTGSATQGWNLITNRPDESTAFDISGRPGDPVDNGAFTSAVAAQAPAPQHVFLQLRNADGSALAGLGGDWIELDFANFKQLQAVSLTGTLAGKVSFEPLKLGLHDQALAPLLDQALASGKAFQLELAVYGDRGTGSDVLLDDYQFGLAGLTNSQVGGSGARTLTFDYGSVRMTHSVFGNTGAYTGSTVEGWDRIRNIKLTAPDSAATSFDGQKAPVAFTDLNVTTQGPAATHYYARFTKSDGNVVGGDNGGGQWFEVFGTKYGASQTLALGTGGLAPGKVAFADLHINLGPSKLTTTLDSMLKLGQTFATVELLGYADGPDGQVKVSTTVFKTIGPNSDTVVPDNGLHDFTFKYGGIVESLTTFDENGAPIGVVTAGWDAITNKADNTPPAAGTDVDPAKTVPTSIGQREIYVQIRNQDGSALTGIGTKWIKLDSAYFSHEQGLTINTTTLQELQLTFKAGTLGPILDQALAQGGKSFQIEVAAYARTGDGSVLTDDYQFGLAGITAHYAGRYGDTYTIAYGSERMLHNVTDPETGAIRDTVVEGWDAVRREVITAPSGQPSSFDAQRAPDSLAGLKTLASSPDPTVYYLRVTYGKTLLPGDNNEQWFAVENFSFGATQDRDPIGEAVGSAAAPGAFNPLTFTLGNSALTTRLASIMAKGDIIKSIDLVGYAPVGGGKLQTVSSATFKQATIASDTVSALTGAHQFSINYTTLVERQNQFDATGAVTATIVRGWDAFNGKADNVTGQGLNYAPDAGHAALDLDQQHAYVQIRNKDGSLIPGLGAQWIAVDAASLGSHNQGEFTLDPLSLSFRPGTLGPQLATALAQGKALQIELAVYDAVPAGGKAVLLDVYQFGRAGLVSDSVSGASHTYGFQYHSYLQKHSRFDAAFKLQGIATGGYDLDSKEEIDAKNLPSTLITAQAPGSETALSVFGRDVPITIVSAAADLTDASLQAGDTVAFTLTFSETVFSTSSTLTLSNGATAVIDTERSSGSTLVYIYTVGAADGQTSDLQATALTGSVTNSKDQAFGNLAFTVIDTNNDYAPNGPDNTVALIEGTLAGTVAVGGSAAATGKLLVTDPDAGEAGVQGAALVGTFGTFTIKANGSWQYKLTKPAAAAAAKATGQPLVDSFNVLSTDGSASADVVVTVAMPTHPGALAFTGTAGADTLYGGGDGDTLKGLGGADKLFGLGGADTLVGGAGADTMTGGAGSDIYWVDDAGDKVVEAASGGTDTVRSTVSFRLAANVENLILTGTDKINGTGNTAANAITGNSGNNVLTGLAGKDTLVGGAGNDTLKGGFGADILTGGSGKDSFVFDTLPAKGEADRITDFTAVDDTILISRKAFAAFTGHAAASLTGADISFTGKIEKASQHLAYDAAKGALFYDDDGTGAHAAVLIATLAGAPALALADFALIA